MCSSMKRASFACSALTLSEYPKSICFSLVGCHPRASGDPAAFAEKSLDSRLAVPRNSPSLIFAGVTKNPCSTFCHRFLRVLPAELRKRPRALPRIGRLSARRDAEKVVGEIEIPVLDPLAPGALAV